MIEIISCRNVALCVGPGVSVLTLQVDKSEEVTLHLAAGAQWKDVVWNQTATLRIAIYQGAIEVYY